MTSFDHRIGDGDADEIAFALASSAEDAPLSQRAEEIRERVLAKAERPTRNLFALVPVAAMAGVLALALVAGVGGPAIGSWLNRVLSDPSQTTSPTVVPIATETPGMTDTPTTVPTPTATAVPTVSPSPTPALVAPTQPAGPTVAPTPTPVPTPPFGGPPSPLPTPPEQARP